jgi:hypothetical protein
LERMNQAFEHALQSHNTDLFAAKGAKASLDTQKIERSRLQQQFVELCVALEIASGRSLVNRVATGGS